MEATELLNGLEIPYELIEHRPTYFSQQLAAAEHIPGREVAKPVIIRADSSFYMCVLPADRMIDFDLLKRQMGAETVCLASEDEMAMLCDDCELGAEPPFGNLYHMGTIMDDTLESDEIILFQAGRHNYAIKMMMKDFKKATKPSIMHFSYSQQSPEMVEMAGEPYYDPFLDDVYYPW